MAVLSPHGPHIGSTPIECCCDDSVLLDFRHHEEKWSAIGADEIRQGLARIGYRLKLQFIALGALPFLALWIIGQKWFVVGIAMTGLKG
jgi:ABC-type maltose transport system permease subunit